MAPVPFDQRTDKTAGAVLPCTLETTMQTAHNLSYRHFQMPAIIAKTNPSDLSDLECDARTLALEIHHDQLWGQYFYIEHLDRVHHTLASVGAARAHGFDAYLHDIYEDGPSEDLDKNRAHVRARFGDDTDAVIWAVSGFGETRRTRQLCIVRGIADLPKPLIARAVNLKMADRIVNMRLCAETMAGNTSLESRNVCMLDRYRKENELGYGELFRMGDKDLYLQYLDLVNPNA